MSFHYAYAKSKSQANSLITNRLSAVSENRLPSRNMKAFPLFREKYSLAHYSLVAYKHASKEVQNIDLP